MRVVLRILGLWIVGGALILLVIDGTRSLADGALVVSQLGETVEQLAPGALEDARETVETHLHPLLWEPVITTLLGWPGWAVFGGLGFMLVALGRRRDSTGFARHDTI